MNNIEKNETVQNEAKTINIAIEEVRSQLFEIISNCGFPASIQELIAKDFYTQVKDASAQIYQIEKTKYDEYLKESIEKNEK